MTGTVAVRAAFGQDGGMPHEDEVDRIVAAWGRQRDDLDFAPLQVLSRVDRLARHLDRARRAAFDASDMEPWEFDVLSALRRAGAPYELSPKTLLQQTLVSSGTMTNRVDRLTARGLVARRTDPKDGRGILVSLTDAGRSAVDSAIADLLGAERAILAGVSDDEQDQLAGLLRRLILGLGD
ncbi:DNA-binding transcriptional regulator, MarR family [Curtobacterium sp. 9128]|nr:DNA-binding transcriptional regulator, MarR family [Curtobacterium sp. 9128]